ncbi:FAD-dependent monooxygenase [Lichenicoccus sp.]|uniref:FAD-dependent monooxygenase n=1 Tax=Lichenicoccus sp. TaxID=2781899 RepID=UPI003D10ABE9
MDRVTDVDVLITGAGPVGLSLAIELGQRGISCLAVERNDRVGYSPRAKTTNVRTREHLRRWGIADTLRSASPIPPDYPPNVVFATRMNGHELARFENAFNGSRVRNEMYSEEAQWVPQYTVEEVLRGHATSLPGVSVAFETELRGLEQDEAGVTAEVADLRSGAVRTIRCAYLVGADGARSFVREAIGGRLSGSGAVAKNHSIIFRSPDLARRQLHGPAIMYWLVNGDVPAVLGPMDQHGLWLFMATKLANDIDPATVDPVELIRRGTGLADLDVEIVRADPWTAFSLVADIYSRGRVFLAGDACHLHPPFGGFGMNMGIGDAVDLGWKIAATLQGWGGPRLLASYDPERRPVHERTIRDSMTNYATVGNQLVRPALEAPGEEGDAIRQDVGAAIKASKAREFYTLGLVLGARYDGSPIVVPDGTEPPPEDAMVYVPSACPGSLAPHAWLADGSSLYDHFGTGLTLLLTGSVDPEEAASLIETAGHRSIPIKLVAPQEPSLPDRYQARFALIRPDQHVAWRGDVLPEPGPLLERVTGHA